MHAGLSQEKLMRPFSTMKRIAMAVLRSEQLLTEIREAVVALSRSEQILAEIREGIAHLGRSEKLLAEIADGISNQTNVLHDQTNVLHDSLMKIVDQRPASALARLRDQTSQA